MDESTKTKIAISSRMDAFASAVSAGMMSVNEARAAFSFPPLYEIDKEAEAELNAPDPQWPNHTHCPNCGAPVNPHKIKCEYCDSYYRY